jgi:hypothetical protein
MYILMCNSTETLEGSYIDWHVQEYTESEGLLCIF